MTENRHRICDINEALEYLLEVVNVYNCGNMIHRNPEVYGDSAGDFVPERWLQDAANRISKSAWCPFERGQRNCTGQELTLLEARIVFALTSRRYEFVKVRLISPHNTGGMRTCQRLV